MTDNCELVREVLKRYQDDHSSAQIDVRQPHPYSIRVRIIDVAFKDQSRTEREREVWTLLKQLDDEVFSNITMVLLLAPSEVAKSLANREFEDPLPSRL